MDGGQWSYPGSVLVHAASRCPGASGGKQLNGRAPQRALPSQKGGASPTPPVSFAPSFVLLPYFSHPCLTPR